MTVCIYVSGESWLKNFGLKDRLEGGVQQNCNNDSSDLFLSNDRLFKRKCLDPLTDVNKINLTLISNQ